MNILDSRSEDARISPECSPRPQPVQRYSWLHDPNLSSRLRGDKLSVRGGLTMSIKVKCAASSSSVQYMTVGAVRECSTFYGTIRDSGTSRNPSSAQTAYPAFARRSAGIETVRPGVCRLRSLGISPLECGSHRLAGCRRVTLWGCSGVIRYVVHQQDGRAVGAHDEVNARERRWL